MKKLKTQRELLNKKLTNYRKLKVTKLENLVTELCERDRVAYQEELLATRDTNLLFKHVKRFSKSATIPKVMSYAGRCSSNDIEKANMLNQYIHSVFSPRKDFCFKDVNPQHSTISNFSICKTNIFEILATLDVTKTRGLDGLPPLFFRKTATNVQNTGHYVQSSQAEQEATQSLENSRCFAHPQEGERKLVENYRPVSLLNIESKIFEKCIYEELSAHFTKFLSSKEHAFVPQRSVYTNMLLFLKKLHEALDKNVHSKVVVFYTDFAKAFDRVPHYELLLKAGQIGIGG